MRWSRSRFLRSTTASLFAARPYAARAQTGTVIRLGTSAIDGYLEPYYAVEQGFFARAGLDVEVQLFSSGARVTTAVAAGAVDAGLSNPVSLANAVDHGLAMLLFAGGVLYNREAIALCVAADSPLRAAKDLNGKTIAVTALEDSNTLHVRAWVDQNGGDSMTLQFVEIPFSAMPAAIARGTVAAAPVAEPALTPAVRAGTLRELAHTLDVYGTHFIIGGWIARTDWIGKNAAVVRRLTETLYATARWANAHQDQTAFVLAKYAKMDPAAVRAMHRSRCADSLTQDMIQPCLEVGYKYNYFKRHLTAADLIARI
jgi:NitT/TauT family transport system substrate-binding protein